MTLEGIHRWAEVAVAGVPMSGGASGWYRLGVVLRDWPGSTRRRSSRTPHAADRPSRHARLRDLIFVVHAGLNIISVGEREGSPYRRGLPGPGLGT